jgi:hypothetical protein
VPVVWVQPVGERLPRQPLQAPDVVREVRYQLRTLRGGQRLPWPLFTLQGAGQRGVDARPPCPRQSVLDGVAGSQQGTQSPVTWRRRGVGRDVLGRHLGDHAWLHAQEVADAVQHRPWRFAELAIAQKEDLVPRKRLVQALQLLAVPAQLEVAPERRPTGCRTFLLQPARRHEVAFGFEPVGPEVRPVRVGAVDRVTQRGDEARQRDGVSNASMGLPREQVERAGLPPQRAGRGVLEQPLVVLTPPHVLPEGPGVPRPASSRGRPVGQEVLRLLDTGQEQPGMSIQRHVERRGPGLGHADQEEIK